MNNREAWIYFNSVIAFVLLPPARVALYFRMYEK